jgi:hypothetical protein
VDVVAWSSHGVRFCAGIRRGNLAAFQFHPEKSGPTGLRLLANFLERGAPAPSGTRGLERGAPAPSGTRGSCPAG